MEIRELKAFCTVAKVLSFTRAATLLDYAQSSITAQIRSLEDELGTKLFERIGRRVMLTGDGERLLQYAEQILALCREAKEAVANDPSPRGTISVGAVESLCIYRLPALLQKYRKICPQVEIILKLGTCTDFADWLKKKEIDIAFSLDRPLSEPDLISETLRTEAMCLVAGPGHNLLHQPAVSPHDLESECLILTERGCSYRSAFEHILREAGVQPASVLEFGSVEAIKQCVISGIGITLLPVIAVAKEIKRGQLNKLNWAGPELDISVQLIYHRDKWLSPAMLNIRDLARSVLKLNPSHSF